MICLTQKINIISHVTVHCQLMISYLFNIEDKIYIGHVAVQMISYYCGILNRYIWTGHKYDMCLMIVSSLVVSVRVLSQFHLQKQGVSC